MLLQSVLFCVSSTSLFNVFVALDRSNLIPILLRSCHIIVFGLPHGILTFLRYSSKAFLAGVKNLFINFIKFIIYLLTLLSLLNNNLLRKQLLPVCNT